MLIGKTKNIISRPVNRLYPVEFANEFSVHDDILLNEEVETNKRPKREAATLGELRRKFMDY